MNSGENEAQSIVKTKRAFFKDYYGDIIIEEHRHPETNERYRPFGLPAYVIYDAKTLRPVFREWYVPGKGQGRAYREGGLPSRISSHPNNASLEWTDEEGFTSHRAFPKEAIHDPHTDEIVGFIYGVDVEMYIRQLTGKPSRHPAIDYDL